MIRLSALLLATALGAAPGARLAPAAADDRPDLVLIVADDLGWRDIDASVPTPNLDWMRRNGIRFRRAYSNPNCSPSRYTLLFGRYAFRDDLGTIVRGQGMGGLPDVENPGAPVRRVSLPEVLKAGGYATAAFGKWHLNNELQGIVAELPRAHGFDRFLAGMEFNAGLEGGYSSWPRIDDGHTQQSSEYSTRAIADAFAQWWRAEPGRKFAYVAFNAPHSPFHVPPPDLLPAGYVVGPALRHKYEAMIVALDTKLGDVLAAVDLARTLVVFVSDNGTPGGMNPSQNVAAPDQNPMKLKGTVFEGGVNVPMIAVGGALGETGVDCDTLVNTTDFFRTFAQLARVDLRRVLPAGYALDSQSFRSSLLRPRAPDRPRTWAFAEIYKPNGPVYPKTLRRRMVTDRRFKLIEQADKQLFYDLLLDPLEEAPLDLALLRPDEAAAFAALEARLATLDHGPP